MFSKPLPPQNLLILQALKKRKNLDDEEQTILFNHQQGYEGELILAALIERHLPASAIPLYSLQLESKGKEFQIDCLLICHDAIYLLDAKHFYGDYIVHDGRWYYAITKKEVSNPLNQLQRCEMLLKEFFEQHKIRLSVSSQLIFTNPEFYLYNAPYSLPAIFPNQHQRFMKKLESSNTGPLSNYHNDIAAKLKQSHIARSRHEYPLKYEYHEMKKGLFCDTCSDLLQRTNSKVAHCRRCNASLPIETAVMQNIRDYQLLFPDNQINVDNISDWINGEVSHDSLVRYLKKHFQLIKQGKSSYYITTS